MRKQLTLTLIFLVALTFSVVKMPSAYALEHTSPSATIDFDASKHLPNTVVSNSNNIKVGTNPNSLVAISGVKNDAKSALVRLTVSYPSFDTKVYSNGMDVIELGVGEFYSTTFLAPLVDGGVSLYANHEVAVQLEVIASFESSDLPGSINAIKSPALRVDTLDDLGGQQVSKDITKIGVLGKGGVPSTDVRAVFYTAVIQTRDNNSIFNIGHLKVPIPYKGIIHISSMAVPDKLGNINISITSNDRPDTEAQLKLFVTGYVNEAKMGAEFINTKGSFVPRINSTPTKEHLEENIPTSFQVPSTSEDSNYSLFMIQGLNYTGTRGTTIDVGDDYLEREQGVVIPAGDTLLPQMVLAKVGSDESKMLIHNGAIDANIWHLGDILDNPVPTNGELDLEITSPKEGEQVKYLDKKKVVIEGKVGEANNTIENVNVWVDDNGLTNIGGAKIEYTETGINWSIDVGPSKSGHYTFTVKASDRNNKTITKQVTVDIEMYDRERNPLVLLPKTIKIDNTALYEKIADDYVEMQCDEKIGAGSVLFSLMTKNTPEGLVRKVDSVDKLYNKCRYNTSDADLTDAVQNMKVNTDLDITGAIDEDWIKEAGNVEAVDENGNTVKGLTIDDISMIDASEADMKGKDEIKDNSSSKDNYCDLDGKPLDDSSNCDINNQIKQNPIQYDTSNSPTSSPTDTGDNSSSTDTGDNTNSPDFSNTDAGDSTNSPSALGDTGFEKNSLSSEGVTPIADASAARGDGVVNTGGSFNPEDVRAMKNNPTKMLGLFPAGTIQDSDQLLAAGSNGPNVGAPISTVGNEPPVSNSLTIINWGKSKTISSPTLQIKFSMSNKDNALSGLFASAVPWSEKNADGSSQAASVNGTAKFELTYTKQIRFFVDAGISVFLGFPGWKFWKIHGSLDAHAAFGTEQTTSYSLDLDILLNFNYTFKFPSIEVDIIEGVLGGAIDSGIILTLSLEAKGKVEKTEYTYQRNGFQIHNFSVSAIKEKTTETKSSTIEITEIKIKVSISFFVEPEIVLFEVIKAGFHISIGIVLAFDIQSFQPPGTTQAKLRGSFEIDLNFDVKAQVGLDLKIWSIWKKWTLFDITFPIFKVNFTATVPKTNIGTAIVDVGQTNQDSTSLEQYRDPSPNSLFLLTKKTDSKYIPVEMTAFQKTGTSIGEDTTSVTSGFVDPDEIEWDSDITTFYKSPLDVILGVCSDNNCAHLESETMPDTANGVDGIGYLALGNAMPLTNHKPAFGTLINNLPTTMSNDEKIQFVYNEILANLNTQNGSNIYADGTINILKKLYNDNPDSLSTLVKSIISLSQIGLISPDNNGHINLQYLEQGDYKLLPVYTPYGTSSPVANYDFKVNDWSPKDDMTSGWNGKLDVSEIGVNILQDPSYDLANTSINISRVLDPSSSGEPILEDGITYYTDKNSPSPGRGGTEGDGVVNGTETLVKKGDTISNNITFNFPATNYGPLVNGRIYLDGAENTDGSLDFFDDTLTSDAITGDPQQLKCTNYDSETGSKLSANTYSMSGNNVLQKDGKKLYFELGKEYQDSITYQSSLSNWVTRSSSANVIETNTTCDISYKAKVIKNGYYSFAPTLSYPSSDLNNYIKGKIARNLSNDTTNGNNENYASKYVPPVHIQGTPREFYATEVFFTNMQKYSYPIVDLQNVEYQFFKLDSATGSYLPKLVSGLSTDPDQPYGKNNQPYSCTHTAKGGTAGLSSCVFSDSSGSIDISYLTPGTYKLVQNSAPPHFKQTGITINLVITKPSNSNPTAGINDQGLYAIPPEVYLESKLDVKSSDSSSLTKIKDSTRSDFPDNDDGSPSDITGSLADFKGKPTDDIGITYSLSFPICQAITDMNCNIGPIGNPYITISKPDTDITLNQFKSMIATTEKDGTETEHARGYDYPAPADETYMGDVTNSDYPASDFVTHKFGIQLCEAIPNPVDENGKVTIIDNSKGCEDKSDPTGHIHFELLRMLEPGSEYEAAADFKEQLEYNQSLILSGSIDSDDGGPSKGIIDAARFNRGFGAVYLKEDNSYPNENTVSGVTKGIPVDGAGVSLYTADGVKVADDVTRTSDSNAPLYTVVDTKDDNFGIARVENLDEGDYYFTINTIPTPFYDIDTAIQYPFNVTYSRLENPKQRATSVENSPSSGRGGTNGDGVVLQNDWYLTNTAIANYEPSINSKTALSNNIRITNFDIDQIDKKSDDLTFSATITYPNDVNRGILYNPKLILDIPSNIDTTNSKIVITRNSSVIPGENSPSSSSATGASSSVIPGENSPSFGRGGTGSDGVVNTTIDFTSTIPLGYTDAANFGPNRLGSTPLDSYTISFDYTVTNNELSKIDSRITYDYDTSVIPASSSVIPAKAGIQTTEISTAANTNTQYPGHIEFRTAEKWENSRWLSHIPYILTNSNNSPSPSSVIPAQAGIQTPGVNNLCISNDTTLKTDSNCPDQESIPYSKDADTSNTLWSDEDGRITIDYLPAGDYTLVPVENAFPVGYILGDIDNSKYENNVSKNADPIEDTQKIDFTIDDYKKESPKLDLNLGTFELYYRPVLDTTFSVKNLSRIGETDYSASTMIKPGDQIEYHYTATYSTDKNLGILHSPNLQLTDNSDGALTIDLDSLQVSYTGSIYNSQTSGTTQPEIAASASLPRNDEQAENSSSVIPGENSPSPGRGGSETDGVVNNSETPVQYDPDTGALTLQDNLLPGSTVDVTYTAAVATVDCVNETIETKFDHKFVDESFNKNTAPIYRSTLTTTVTELHSIGTIFLNDAELSLFKDQGNTSTTGQPIGVNINSISGSIFSLHSNSTGTIVSSDLSLSLRGSEADAAISTGNNTATGENSSTSVIPAQAGTQTSDESSEIDDSTQSIIDQYGDNEGKLITLEYLEPGNYYFTQSKAPIGYDITKNKHFKFTVQDFNPDDYDNNSSGDNSSSVIPAQAGTQTTTVTNPSRVFEIDEPYSTIAFDYTPVLEISTQIKNLTRQGTAFSDATILKPGDKYQVLTRVAYPKDATVSSSGLGSVSTPNYDTTGSSYPIIVHNRGTVYKPTITDPLNKLTTVLVSSDGGETFSDAGSWKTEEFEFGKPGSDEDADNSSSRLSPGDEYFITYEETYDENSVYDEPNILNTFYAKSTIQDSVSVYYGKLNLSTIEHLLNAPTSSLPNVAFSLFDASGSRIPLSNVPAIGYNYSLDSTQSNDLITDSKALGAIQYLEKGDYYLKTTVAPQGNIFDPNYKYKFTIPDYKSVNDNTALNLTLDPVELPIRYVQFLATTSSAIPGENSPSPGRGGTNGDGVVKTGVTLQDTRIIVLQNNPNPSAPGALYQATNIPVFGGDQTNSVYATDSNSTVLFHHFPEGTFSIDEVYASEGYEFTTGSISPKFSVDNHNFKTGSESNTIISVNSNNRPIGEPSVLLNLINTTNPGDTSVHPNDLVNLSASITMPKDLSFGSYRIVEFSFNKSNAPDLKSKSRFTDVYLDAIPLDKKSYTVDETSDSLNITILDDAIPYLQGGKVLNIATQYEIPTKPSAVPNSVTAGLHINKTNVPVNLNPFTISATGTSPTPSTAPGVKDSTDSSIVVSENTAQSGSDLWHSPVIWTAVYIVLALLLLLFLGLLIYSKRKQGFNRKE